MTTTLAITTFGIVTKEIYAGKFGQGEEVDPRGDGAGQVPKNVDWRVLKSMPAKSFCSMCAFVRCGIV